MNDPRRAYRVVDAFEDELCSFTGAPFAVAVNSCTNATLLSLSWVFLQGLRGELWMPRRTYIGVLHSVLNAGFGVRWREEPNDWQERGWYEIGMGTGVVDRARSFGYGGLNHHGPHYYCLSMHSAKQLPVGRGGAILTDNEEAAEWFRAARMDGRAPGDNKPPVFPGFHCSLPPDAAARGLDILSRWTEPPKPLPFQEYPDLSQWWPR